MFTRYSLFIFVLVTPSIIQCDLTNLDEVLSFLNSTPSVNQPIGFLSQGNFDVVKRYLPPNVNVKIISDVHQLLNAIDNGTVIAGVTTGRAAQDLEPRYHVFSSRIISPQAMLLAPDYNSVTTPYGLRNISSNDLFGALSAAIADVQKDDIDETLFTRYGLTDLPRVYTCRQDTQLPVVNRNATSGILRDILLNEKKLIIGGLGPRDWGVHEGNYTAVPPIGFYPALLDEIVKKLGQLKGSDGVEYGEKLSFERKYYTDMTLLFRDLLDGNIHATDVYTLVDAPYNGTGQSCSMNVTCREGESCVDTICTLPQRPRSLHFRVTCTTAGRDTKFITKKSDGYINSSTDAPRETPKTRWIGYVLVFVALFGTIFVTLLVLIRRKKNYRVEHTLPGGFGKFVRLQEESEPPMDGIDAFDDHIVQSPRDNSNSAI